VNGWRERAAPAKLNLALVVGPTRADGKHEVVTVLERLGLADTVGVRSAGATRVMGFEDDTLVRGALERLAWAAAGERRFEARIQKRIPVAAGLGGGSSDAAAALALANELLDAPLEQGALRSLAASLGADVPFFLHDGAGLGDGDGSTVAPLVLPRDYVVLLVLPAGATKRSTADVYAAFDARRGERGFERRRDALLAALNEVRVPADLAALPPNDLASSPVADALRGMGAFRADVSGAGPTVYGLFADRDAAARAQAAFASGGAPTWVAEPG
jgi:4-diphosphocytidyl-2-C-methyl-D-erythritol kinase